MSNLVHVPKALPDPVLNAKGDPVIFECSICGAINVGTPPHGEGQPCPIAVMKAAREEAAAKRDEQSAIASQFMMNDLKQLMRKMGVIPEENE